MAIFTCSNRNFHEEPATAQEMIEWLSGVEPDTVLTFSSPAGMLVPVGFDWKGDNLLMLKLDEADEESLLANG